MNPVIYLQKLFGSNQTKIRAIGFEIEKLEDEVNYNNRELCVESDFSMQEYLKQQVFNLEYSIQEKHSIIRGLQK
jgi:hypothetical protein